MSEKFNIVILGAGAVGKSALVLCYHLGEFLEGHDPTIEDTYRKEAVIENKQVILNILDTAGQEDFRHLESGWIESGQGFLILYSITDESSFQRVELIKGNIVRLKPEAPIILVATKSDLDDIRVISQDQGSALAKKWGCKFVETSAKRSDNVEWPFEELTKMMRLAHQGKENSAPKKKGGFCVLL